MWVFRKAKFLTAVSPYLKDEISKFTKCEVMVIPNPSPRDPTGSDKIQAETTMGLNDPTITMISNGWAKLKNAKPAMQAFNELLKTIPNATFHMFGFDFQVNGPAHQWAKENQIHQNMVFHGPTTNIELLDFLSQSTILLHPALEECCPLSLIEAMSFGLPVIGGESSGGVPWILDFGNAGLLADVSSPIKMCEKINELLKNKQLYLNLREQSIQRVKLFFAQDAVASAYEEMYKFILKDDK